MNAFEEIIRAANGASHIMIVFNGFDGSLKPEADFARVMTKLCANYSACTDIVVPSEWVKTYLLDKNPSLGTPRKVIYDQVATSLPSFVLIMQGNKCRAFMLSGMPLYEIPHDDARRLQHTFAPQYV